jgi:hypothetical protein
MAVTAVGLAAYAMLYDSIIKENTIQMDELNATVCGGNVDFAYTSRADAGLLLAMPTKSFALNLTEPAQQRMMKSTAQLWNRKNDTHQDYMLAWLAPNEAVFTEFSETTMYSLTYNQGVGMPTCESSINDVFGANMPAFVQQALIFHTGLSNATGCLDMVSACSDRSQAMLRVFCPTQCGCDMPLSGLFYKGPVLGCPRVKCVARLAYQAAFSQIKCEDPTVADLSLTGWARFWDEFGVQKSLVKGGFFNMNGMNSTVFAEYAKFAGCEILNSEYMAFTFCFESEEVSGLAPFCPQACGCRSNPDLAGCPPSCAAYDMRFRSSIEDLACEDLEEGGLHSTSVYAEFLTQMDIRFVNSWKSTQRFVPGLPDTLYEWWMYWNVTGCPGRGTDEAAHIYSFCSDLAAGYDLNGICPLACWCDFTGSSTCPPSCAAPTGKVFRRLTDTAHEPGTAANVLAHNGVSSDQNDNVLRRRTVAAHESGSAAKLFTNNGVLSHDVHRRLNQVLGRNTILQARSDSDLASDII